MGNGEWRPCRVDTPSIYSFRTQFPTSDLLIYRVNGRHDLNSFGRANGCP